MAVQRDPRADFERRLNRANQAQMQGKPRRGGILSVLIGIIVGLGVGPFLYVALSQPGLYDDLAARGESYYEQLRIVVPEEYRDYTGWGVLAVAVLLGIVLLRGLATLFARSRIFFGALIGIFLWVPFGTHIRTLAPQVDDQMPELQAALDRTVTSNRVTLRIRELAETLAPPASLNNQVVATETAETIEGAAGSGLTASTQSN